MKLVLLHGPAIEASRRKLQELRQRFNPDNVLVFEKGEDERIILTTLSAQSLFDEARLVIVENPAAVFRLPNVDMISNTSTGKITLVVWFDHTVDTKKWPGFEYLFFPESQEVSVFRFLDYLAAHDAKAFLEIEKLKKADFDVHYLITMVFYLLRNLISTSKTAPEFVKKKLAKQRTNFSRDKLVNIYRDILEIDFKLKSGFLEKDQAEFLLVSKFLL